MPATPIYALPYPAATDPADVPLDLQKLATQVALVLGGALSATPPATPIEGQLWAMSPAAGVVWVFRYNAASASAYKWEFVGGGSWYVEYLASQNVTLTTYQPSSPTVVLPRAGDYEVAWGCGYSSAGTAANGAFIAVGTSVPPDDSSTMVIGSASRMRMLPGLAASATLRIYLKVTNTSDFQRAYMNIRPVRVS